MKELYFTDWNDTIMGPCVYRCRLDSADNWGPAELIVARFAGEPTLDEAGNLYFVHHYYKNEQTSEMWLRCRQTGSNPLADGVA